MDDTDSIIQEAIQRRDSAREEARRWEQFIQMYEYLASSRRGNTGSPYTTRAAQLLAKARGAYGGGYQGEGPAFGEGVGAKVMETETVAREILRQRDNRPIPTRELYNVLTDRGVSIGGKDPLATLTARLVRAPSLENVRPLGWRLKHMPLQTNEAAGPTLDEQPTASESSTPHDAVMRGEVAHDNIE